MSFIVVDIEADGKYPGDYSMVSFGAVVVEPTLSKTFYGTCKPISEKWLPDALAISGLSREETMTFPEPTETMPKFIEWVKANSKGRPVFMSDNLAFDWMWICYYTHKYGGENPFGFSGRRIGDLYCGLVKDCYAKWKHLRKTYHSHDPLQDSIGNAEVLLHMKEHMGLDIKLT